MRKVGKVLLWFFLGLILTYAATIAIGIAYMEVANVSQREGAAAMGLVFIIGPLCALIGGVVGAIIAIVRLSASKGSAP